MTGKLQAMANPVPPWTTCSHRWKTNFFLQFECASFLLPCTRSHCAFLRRHKQPSARMLPQRCSEGATAECPNERDVAHLPPFCGARLIRCPVLPPPVGDAPSFPQPQHPQSLMDTPCQHLWVELLRVRLSGMPLRLCLAAASCGGHSNPCPFAVSKKCLNTELQGGRYTLCLMR